MFKISPIQDENTKQKHALLCNTNAKEGYFAYQMIDTDTLSLMGFSQFDINGDTAYIKDLKEPSHLSDFEAMFILSRQTMNFIDMCGCHKCIAAPDAGNERLLLAIGFKKQENGEYFVDMTDMFTGHCSGETVKLD